MGLTSMACVGSWLLGNWMESFHVYVRLLFKNLRESSLNCDRNPFLTVKYHAFMSPKPWDRQPNMCFSTHINLIHKRLKHKNSRESCFVFCVNNNKKCIQIAVYNCYSTSFLYVPRIRCTESHGKHTFLWQNK